jgi:type I restriction enzyme S subunit
MNSVKLNEYLDEITKGTTPTTIGGRFLNEGINFVKAECLNTGRIIDKSSLSYISPEIHRKLNRSILKEGDLLFSIAGHLGKMAIVRKTDLPANTNQAVAILRINQKKADVEFLYYYLSSKLVSSYISSQCAQSVQPNINLAQVGELPIVNFPFTYQQKIASVLSVLDSKIELNNRINAELEAMAKTLYDYWFVQFDFPNAKGKPYKTSGGKMVWNEELKREIPEGWEVTLMQDWLELNKSGDWGKEEPEGNSTTKVTCIRGADINGLNGLGELKPPTRYILQKNSFKILEPNDVVVEISGGSPTQSTGRMAYITEATIKRFESPLICSNFCKPITIKNKKLLYNFAYYWNSLYEAGIFFGYEGKTSGIKNFLFDSFVSSYYTVVPEESIVNKFYDLMENIQTKKQTALAENQQLASLRDWLLPMLMNGQVKVK